MPRTLDLSDGGVGLAKTCSIKDGGELPDVYVLTTYLSSTIMRASVFFATLSALLSASYASAAAVERRIVSPVLPTPLYVISGSTNLGVSSIYLALYIALIYATSTSH